MRTCVLLQKCMYAENVMRSCWEESRGLKALMRMMDIQTESQVRGEMDEL